MSETDSRLEEHKAIVRQMNDDVWGGGNLDLVDEFVADDYVEHNTASPEDIHGPAGYKANVEMVRSAFPDVTVTTEHLLAEGDRVLNHFTISGTHQGDLMGIEPTGAEVEVSGMAIAEFDDGRLVEDWSVIDLYGLMEQLEVA